MTKQPKDIRNQIIKAARDWALGRDAGPARTRELRQQAILLNHAHYLENIPLYRKLAEEEGCDRNAGIDTIKKKMMLSADIFKSYEQKWLDDNDFGRMNRWLSGIYHRNIDTDVTGIKTIDGWIDSLEPAGVHIVYSSGTSGAFSFVPRDAADRELAKTANIACLTPLLSRIMTGGRLPENLLRFAARMAGKNGLKDFDAVFLGFRQGRMGNQSLIGELAPLFRRSCFLYDTAITGTALRCLRRGARTEEEQKLLDELREQVIGQRETGYLRILDDIRQSGENGQKVFIFGAPYQFRELCDIASGHNLKPALRKGSLVLFGGGWKTFEGEAMDRETLVSLITGTLEIPPQMILEGYSMTEINVLTLRCEHGRFHIPPVIEPVILDEALEPVEGADVKGAFGFLDPLAVSCPGFIVSGDYVRMVTGECDCGLSGPAITEIGRMPGSEVKGCGGIMGSISA